jgi:hypothetical protein
MNATRKVTVTLELDDDTAWALAQLAKRIGWQDIRTHAESDEEAYTMQAGLGELRDALACAGFDPR